VAIMRGRYRHPACWIAPSRMRPRACLSPHGQGGWSGRDFEHLATEVLAPFSACGRWNVMNSIEDLFLHDGELGYAAQRELRRFLKI
jgi:hypothetical protein